MDDLPDVIRIGPIDFSVRDVDRLTCDDNTRKLDGHIKYNTSEILLERDMETHHKRHVVWHEVIHGLLTLGQFDLGDDEEKVVDALAYGVMSVLRDNPWLREPS